jgi:hypothetical protein
MPWTNSKGLGSKLRDRFGHIPLAAAGEEERFYLTEAEVSPGASGRQGP